MTLDPGAGGGEVEVVPVASGYLQPPGEVDGGESMGLGDESSGEAMFSVNKKEKGKEKREN